MARVPCNVFTIDFETDNIDPKIAHPIEVAIFGKNVMIASYIALPEGFTVPPETSAIHHIVDDDLLNAPSWEYTKKFISDFRSDKVAIFVAHNASYEQDILGKDFTPDLPWICTYKCALRVWPDAPSHKNEVLRYWLGLPLLGRSFPQNAHNAGHDAEVTFQILEKLLDHATLEQMIEWSKEPGLLPSMPMGKHFKQKWDMIPWPYMEWCIKQADMREDVVFCCKREMARRNAHATPRSS